MAVLRLLILTLFLSACQTTNFLSTVELRKQELKTKPVSQTIPVIPPCGNKDKMRKQLLKYFKEEPLILGKAKGGAIITIFAGPNAHWTMTRTVNNTLCLMMVGQGLKVIKYPSTEISI